MSRSPEETDTSPPFLDRHLRLDRHRTSKAARFIQQTRSWERRDPGGSGIEDPERRFSVGIQGECRYEESAISALKDFFQSGLVRLFWSLRFRGSEPATWLHEDLVRRRVNHRISGSENVWPLDGFGAWLDENHDGRRFESGVSLGCGEGALERAVIKQGLCQSMLGLDLSGEAVRSAARYAEEAGMDSIGYRRADMNCLAFADTDDFDIAFFHQSLHHVEALEHCLETVARALPADGFLYLDEYIGPSRDHWVPDLLSEAQRVFDELPSDVKRRPRLELPVDWRDPSEAVRSADIVRVVRQFFDVVEQRDYGGNLLAVTYPWLDFEGCDADTRSAVLTRILDVEDALLAAGEPSYYTVIVAVPR